MHPHPFVQIPVGRRLHSGSDLQHAVESYHWPEPAIESEHELVEIALQVLRADPVVRSQEPRIEVPEDDVNHGEVLVRLDMVTPDRHGFVPVAQLVQVVVASPPVRTSVPGCTLPRMTGSSVSCLRFGMTRRRNLPAMKPRPCPPRCCGRWPEGRFGSGPGAFLRGRTSTMPTTSVLWCLPRPSPCVAPPTYVSSTSTSHSAPIRSRSGRTIAARSLWSIWNAVS
jgi:hypothetical protein